MQNDTHHSGIMRSYRYGKSYHPKIKILSIFTCPHVVPNP